MRGRQSRGAEPSLPDAPRLTGACEMRREHAELGGVRRLPVFHKTDVGAMKHGRAAVSGACSVSHTRQGQQ